MNPGHFGGNLGTMCDCISLSASQAVYFLVIILSNLLFFIFIFLVPRNVSVLHHWDKYTSLFSSFQNSLWLFNNSLNHLGLSKRIMHVMGTNCSTAPEVQEISLYFSSSILTP